MLNDDDKAAVEALLARYVRAWDTREADTKLQAEVAARLVSHNAHIQNLKSAFLVFGFEVGATAEVWKRVKDALGEEIYARGIQKGKRPAPQILEGELVASQNTLPAAEKEPAKPKVPEVITQSTSTPTVREIILSQLKLAAADGMKVAAIKKFMETAYGLKTHEKTVGMTLYRLSINDLVRREGRTWFFVPPKEETKNPAADTAGSEDDAA